MSKLIWDAVGTRTYETGVDHGVLYIPDGAGNYPTGVAWSGLTTVTESPSGAESNKQYADNMAYLDLYSAELFGGTIEALTTPPEFDQFDGLGKPTVGGGVSVGQQPRRPFGLCYRTLVGNDTEDTDYGYKLHLVYGVKVSPTERAYGTVNDSPEAIAFSWTFSTTAVPVPGFKPSALIVIDSTKESPVKMAALERELYGDTSSTPNLPLPAWIIANFAGSAQVVVPGEPTFNALTNEVTIPSTAHVVYSIGGEEVLGGSVITLDVDTPSIVVTWHPAGGYTFPSGTDDDRQYNYVP